MDLEKAFDCIPHDLLIAKFAANGSKQNCLKIHLNTSEKSQEKVRLNNYCSVLMILFLGFLGPILFTAFLNGLFYVLNKLLYKLLPAITRYHHSRVLVYPYSVHLMNYFQLKKIMGKSQWTLVKVFSFLKCTKFTSMSVNITATNRGSVKQLTKRSQ